LGQKANTNDCQSWRLIWSVVRTITLSVYAHLVSNKDGAAAAIDAVFRGETKW
jgi:hypothetical protein